MTEATPYNPDIPRTGSGIVFAAEVAISSQQVVLTLSEHSCLRGQGLCIRGWLYGAWGQGYSDVD
jgi:hypothetical protein